MCEREMKIYANPRNSLEGHGSSFFNSVMTGHETWLYPCDSENKNREYKTFSVTRIIALLFYNNT